MSIQTHQVEWQQARQFLGTSDSGQAVLMDGRAANEGVRTAASPMELVALGLGGCSSVDVVSILEKKKLAVAGCKVIVQTERANTVPAVFTQIHLHFVITGCAISEKAVAQAVSLSADKYCSIAKMLADGNVVITHDFEIISS